MDTKREFEKLLRSLSHRHQLWRVFSDFCEMAALTFANAIRQHEEREARYLKIIQEHSKEEQAVFPQLLGCTVMGLEDVDRDFLGESFMGLELGNHWHGQFFTPISLCRMMAELTLHDLDPEQLIEERGFVTAHEPACGAGATIIGLVGAMRARKLNPQTQLHVTAIDKDPTAAHMCFVQLALLGIPAQVIVGDTLRMEMREAFYTPHHWLGMWDRKIARGYALGSKADAARPLVTTPTPANEEAPPLKRASGQLSLF